MAEIQRAIQLANAGVSYPDIGRVMFLDGLSPVLRSGGGVRATLRDHCDLPVRRGPDDQRSENVRRKSVNDQ